MKIGATRKELAHLVTQKLKEIYKDELVELKPDDIYSQPNGGSIICDWATWYGWAIGSRGARIYIESYDTMTKCVRHGISAGKTTPLQVMVFSQIAL